jgi:hypothetical protein
VITVEHPTRATSQYRKSFFAVLIGFVLLFLLLDRTPYWWQAKIPL